MKKPLILLFALAAIYSCRHRDTFCITGNISGAADTMLYLEHLTLGEGAVPIDSIRLKEDGTFCFRGEAVGTPEFYRLRIGSQGINLSIDSTETVRIKADMKNMSFGYSVEGSGTCDTIRLLCLKLADVEREARRISADRNYTIQERDSLIERLVDQYKMEVKLGIIQHHYGSAYSYYACFQTLATSLSSIRCTTRATSPGFEPSQMLGTSNILRANAPKTSWASSGNASGIRPSQGKSCSISTMIKCGNWASST